MKNKFDMKKILAFFIISLLIFDIVGVNAQTIGSPVPPLSNENFPTSPPASVILPDQAKEYVGDIKKTEESKKDVETSKGVIGQQASKTISGKITCTNVVFKSSKKDDNGNYSFPTSGAYTVVVSEDSLQMNQNILQKLFKEILIPVDDFKPGLFGV